MKKKFSFGYQILLILSLTNVISYALANNIDEFGHVTSIQHDGSNHPEAHSVETTRSIITTVKEKRDYLWFLTLVIVFYFAYKTNQKAKKLAKELSELKQKSVPQEEPRYWLATALPKILIFIAILSILATILVFGIYFNAYFDGSIATEHAKWGTFGDFVGGTLNSIFGLLGLVALLFTIVLQSRELQLARQEFKKSANSSQEKSNTFKRQQFENTFFHLLNLHNNFVNSLELRETFVLESIIRGRECLAKCYEIFKEKNYFERYAPIKVKGLPQIQQEIIFENTFKEFLVDIKTHYQLHVEHYFVHLCQMVEFLGKDETQVFLSESGTEDKKAKQRYMSIILSQLSDAEMTLLFFYCISNSSNCWQLMMEYGWLNDSPDWLTTEYCEYYFKVPATDDKN